MQGEESPGGTEILKISFVPGPKWTGGLSVLETPELFGPRNCGQRVPAFTEFGSSEMQKRQSATRFIDAWESSGAWPGVQTSKLTQRAQRTQRRMMISVRVLFSVGLNKGAQTEVCATWPISACVTLVGFERAWTVPGSALGGGWAGDPIGGFDCFCRYAVSRNVVQA
jgi:hypothetical protein